MAISDDILGVTAKIEDTLGDNNVVADNLAELIQIGESASKCLLDKDAEIASLKSKNEKLMLSNGNLLKMVPQIDKEPKQHYAEEPDSKEPPKDLSLAFDKYGNFIR